MKIGICPGSFDPVTLGHMDIITRGAALFDKLVVLVLVNPKKQPTFSANERCEMLKAAIAEQGCTNVQVDVYEGLLADYAREIGAAAIIKGLRAVSDYEYEFQMALTNKVLCPQVETIFLNTNAAYMYLSSSVVKQVASFGGDISRFVPKSVLPAITRRLLVTGNHKKEEEK